MTLSASSPSVAISVNGADNVGKSTQLRWLARAIPGGHYVGTIGAWDPRWGQLAAGDFAGWWFRDSTTDEHVALIFASHAARRAGSGGPLALEDRGHPMLLALCAATAAVKEERDPEDALDHVEALAAEHATRFCHEVHVLLRHARDPQTEARLALAREEQPVSQWYSDYQHALAHILDLQAHRGDYDLVVLRGERPILPIQRELRDWLRSRDLSVEPLPATALDRLCVLGGMSESGKSTVGELLRTEHGVTRLKIGYLLDVAAARASVEDPYQRWDEWQQAEALTEEVLQFSQANKSSRLVLESAHRYEATRHLQRIWGQQLQMVYVEADTDTRLARSAETPASLGERDDIKRSRGAHHLAVHADWVVQNSGSLPALKMATARLAPASGAQEPPASSPVTGSGSSEMRGWLNETVDHLVDSSVAAVLATGSTGQLHWREGWSDVDLLVIRDTLPLSWIQREITPVSAPFGVKTGVSLFTIGEVMALRVPPRVVHALRLASRDGHGVLFARDGFALPVPGPDADDQAARAELPHVVMMLRRLVAADPVDPRAVYKHLVLLMKILLRADGVGAESSDDVRHVFQSHHPVARVGLPTLDEVDTTNRQEDQALSARVLASADALLNYHDTLDAILTTPGQPGL